MAWAVCVVIGCTNRIRQGLRRFGEGVDGQDLADGRTCWRCRAKQARKDRPVRIPGRTVDLMRTRNYGAK